MNGKLKVNNSGEAQDLATTEPDSICGLYYKSQYDRNLRHWRRNFYATNSGVAIYDDGVVKYDASIMAA